MAAASLVMSARMELFALLHYLVPVVKSITLSSCLLFGEAERRSSCSWGFPRALQWRQSVGLPSSTLGDGWISPEVLARSLKSVCSLYIIPVINTFLWHWDV